MDIEEIVINLVKKIAAEENISLGELTENTALVDDIGLQSLQLARIVATLEMEHGLDITESSEVVITDIRTIGDLCDACESVAAD